MSDIKKVHVKLVEDFIEKTKNLLCEKLDDDCIAIDIGTANFALSELFMEKSGLKLSKIIVKEEGATAENLQHAIFDIESSLPDELKSEAPFDIATSFATQFGDLKTAILNVNSLLRLNGVFCFSIAIHNCLGDLCDELIEKHPSYKDKIANCLNSLGGNEKLSEELPKMLSECDFTIDYFEVMPITHDNEENDDLKEIVSELLPFLNELPSEDADLISSDCCALLKAICESNENNQLEFLHCVASKNSSNIEAEILEQEANIEAENDVQNLDEGNEANIEADNLEQEKEDTEIEAETDIDADKLEQEKEEEEEVEIIIEANSLNTEDSAELENLDKGHEIEEEEKELKEEDDTQFLDDKNEATEAEIIKEGEKTQEDEIIGEALILEEEKTDNQDDVKDQGNAAEVSEEQFV